MLPTQIELDQASEVFDRDWGGVDEVLYGDLASAPWSWCAPRRDG